ncbi:MAG: hypothetical protein ACRCVU_10970, partial [Flavobacterium sp.]
ITRKMRRLTIKNIGPIKSVTIDLKRINVLIGLQSSGKSTINKIACHCSWVEKELYSYLNAVPPELVADFEELLIDFHKLEGFFSDDSYIKYETGEVEFTFNGIDCTFNYNWKTNSYWQNYKRNKTIYIPAERNIIAIIPNWYQIKLENTNLKNFLSHWQDTRLVYSNKALPILDLGVNYKYNTNKETDELHLTSTNKTINIKNASSGLQSIVPLYAMTEYLTSEIYKQKESSSIKEDLLKEQVELKITQLVQNSIIKEALFNTKDNLTDKTEKQLINYFSNNINTIQQSNIFLEEPEVNLFPVTQKDLVKFLVKSTYHNADGREHSLFLTTHSPYILTTLNNLIYANDCANANKDEVSKILGEEYWVDFNDVGVWFVRDGVVEDILDQELKQIDATRIDEVSQLLNDEFDNLLKTQYHEV